MAFKTTTRLDSDIFDDVKRRQAVSGLIHRSAKDCKNLTKRRMIESKPTGRLYRRRRGPGFVRSHRASAKGKRPAIDTGKLLNSVRDQRQGEFKATTDVNVKYAEYLQSDRLGREIITDADAAEEQRKLDRNAERVLVNLT